MRRSWLYFLLSIIFCCNFSLAQTTSNTVNPDWTNNGDWTGTAPDYDTNQSAILNHNSTIGGNPISINNGHTLTINAGVTLTTDETLTIKEGGTLIINGEIVGTDGGKEFKIEKGTLIVNAGGVFNWAGDWTSDDNPVSITINGDVDVGGDMSNKVTITGTGSFDVGGTLNNDVGTIFGCTDSGDGCCMGSGCALPIELLSFEGEYNNGVVHLSWSTASEINNDYFTVERSVKNLEWDTVGFVKGAGDSNSILNYKYVDQLPLNGFGYYRLRQTDFDDSFTYSNVIVVDSEALSSDIELYPNPVSDKFTLPLEVVENREVTVVNNNGKQFVLPTKTNLNSVEFDVSQIPKGIYFLSISGQPSIRHFKFVVN